MEWTINPFAYNPDLNRLQYVNMYGFKMAFSVWAAKRWIGVHRQVCGQVPRGPWKNREKTDRNLNAGSGINHRRPNISCHHMHVSINIELIIRLCRMWIIIPIFQVTKIWYNKLNKVGIWIFLDASKMLQNT